jgi:hypothetical protein
MNKFTLDFFRTKSKTAIKGLFVLFAFLLMNTQTSWGQLTEGFETGMPTSYAGTGAASSTGADNGTATTLGSGSWILGNVIRGTAKKSGLYSAQIRSATGASLSTPVITNGVGTVTFWAAASSTSAAGVQLQISTDGGATYTQVGSTYVHSSTFAATNTFYQISAVINNAGTNIRLRWYRTAATIYIDDVVTTSYTASAPVINNATLTASTTVLAANATIYTVTASGTPTSFAASGLPTGLSISNAGVISGTPATGTAGSSPYTVGLTATNGTGTSSTVNITLTINKANQTITFTPTLITKAIGDTPVTLTATSTSGLAVSYGTSDSGIASLSGSTLSFVSAGTATITASQAGNVDYNAATSVTQDQVVSAAPLSDQTITFGTLTPVTYGDSTFDLTATASSSLPVTYTSSNTAVATVSGSTVTIVGAGSTNITASQAGNGSFNPAADVIQALTVNEKALTISGATAASRAYNALLTTNITGTLTGIINSDDVTFDGTLKGTFADANVADGIAVTATCTLSGTKAGNYALTQPTGLTANITQASQTITFGALANKTVGDADYLPGATSPTSAINPITYASSNTTVATIVAGQIQIVGAGSTNITASQAGNINYAAATPEIQMLTVVAPPLVAFDLAVTAGDQVSSNSTYNTTNMATSTITRGAGLTASANADRYNATSWAVTSIANAISGNDYMEFTVAPNSGYQFAVSSILFQIQRSASGLTGIALRSSVDDYATNLDAEKAVVDNTSTQSFTFNFSQANSAYPVTYRLYGFAEATAGSAGIGDGTGNDIFVTGTVEAVTSTTWNGTAWTSGTPSASIDAIIDGNYSGASFTAKNLTVNATKTLTVATVTSVTVINAIVNNGTITVENNANLRQTAVANTNSGSGTATVKRNSTALKRLDYTMWSSPVSGTLTLEQFSPKTSRDPNRFYTYNGGNAFAAIATTSTFEAGKGYLIRMPNDASTSPTAFEGVFTGTLNNGTITVSGLDSDKYYSVGNPYPSTISADAFLTANPGTLYFWRKTNGAVGGAYATYNGTGAASGAGSEVPNGTIQVGQGFIAKTGAAASSLVFTNAMRLGTTTNQFFKTKNTAEKSRVWLDLTATTGGLFSQALVGYLDGATLGVDNGYDGKYLNDSPTDAALTSIVDGGEYTIQGRPAFDVTDVVALGFKTGTAGDFTIAINKKDGALASQDIYLVDSKTGIETDLNAGSYTFNAAVGTDNTRFSLKYQKTLKVDAPTFDDNSVKVYQNKGAIYVNSTSKTIKTIQVYDVQGRLIAQQKNVNAATATIHNLKAVSQLLIVKVSAVDNSVVSKKVMN